jgi:hypothetical protein
MSVIKERAQKIKTIPNSPAKPWQLQVMKDVFYDITKYPSENWIAIIAVVIGRYEQPLESIQASKLTHSGTRTCHQVKCWFSNERQRCSKVIEDPFVVLTTEDGETIKFRPEALQFYNNVEWSNSMFEGVITLNMIQTRKAAR